MPIIPLYGHQNLRRQLTSSAERGTLPASLLFHGPRGVGKQRLALWFAEYLLCDGDSPPCGTCQSCRYAGVLAHPDIHWYFPRPRLKDTDADSESIRDDINDEIRERLAKGGLYACPPGNEGIFVATIRALTRAAGTTPAIGKRKIFIVGDAERMVAQEGADQAANAFLKLLEEPLADTTIILTSSEPGALLPTIRSRVASVRVPRLRETEMREFLADPLFRDAMETGHSTEEMLRIAAGAPGALLAGSGPGRALAAARRIIDAAVSGNAPTIHATTLAQGGLAARGAFSETLESLVVILNERVRDALHRSDESAALSSAKGIEAVSRAQQHASHNVNPQLITSRLMRELRGAAR